MAHFTNPAKHLPRPERPLEDFEPETGNPYAAPIGLILIIAPALIWAYWTPLAIMVERWSTEAQYSHGFIVPIFALFLLWLRRDMLKEALWRPFWLGLCLVCLSLGLRTLSAVIDFDFLDAFSLLPMLVGLVLLIGGIGYLRWSWPAIAFLAFMLPLPFQVEHMMAQPLRRLASQASTYTLQTLGVPAVAEGNIIYIEDVRMGVVDTCSGLGMLMTFYALAAALAILIRAPLWQRLALIPCAIPIAVIANVVRISATGVAYYLCGKNSQLAHLIFHDLAGWLMMPLALVLLWLTWLFLDHLWIKDASAAAPLPLIPGSGRA